MNIERTNRTAWLGLGVVLLLALAALSFFGGMTGHAPMVGYEGRQFFGGGPWFWGSGLIGLVVRVAVWVGLIMLGLSLFRRRWGSWRPDADTSSYPEAASPQQILMRRYAAGEITREQFEEMRRVLDQTPAAQ